MPDLNIDGLVAHGTEDNGACLDNVEFDAGGITSWFSRTVIVYRRLQSAEFTIALYDIESEVITDVVDTDATILLGNANGHWVAWDAVNGIVASTGWTDPTADALYAIGPSGEICYKQDGGLTVTIRRISGVEYNLTDGPADDVCIVGNGQVIWQEANVLKTFGLPTTVVLDTDVFSPKALLIDGAWWVAYFDDNDGDLVIHPFGSLEGYRLDLSGNPDHDWYDVSVLDGSPSTIRIAWSTSAEEEAGDILTQDIDTATAPRESLGDAGDPIEGSTGTGDPTVDDAGVRTITISGSFGVAAAAEEVVQLPIEIFPAFSTGDGRGRIIHPTLGSFDYEVKPDEWVNIDADAVIAPIWASSRTLTSAANVLWEGHLRDVTVEERWKALGGLAMPMTQMRMLMAIWTTPIDPDVGYVLWYPNYITEVGFKVLPVNLSAGGQGIVFDDVVNYKDEDDEPIGWITAPVTFTLKLVERL